MNHLPLHSSQTRLWILAQQDQLNPSYNLEYTYHFKGGELNFSLFNESINVLFNRHQIVFSVFKCNDGEPYCEIIPKEVKIDLIDFSKDIPEIGKEKIIIFAGEDTRKPFNLETGPLYRFYILKLDDTNFYFHATIHHIIFDMWSWSVFVKDLNVIYNQLASKQEAKLDLLNFQSYDYAHLDRKSDSLKNEKELVSFWKENLKDCPKELKFPFDYPRKNTSTGLGGREYIKIPADITSRIKRIGQQGNTSLFRTLIASLGILFQKYSGENDICLGTYVANRPNLGMENIFGMFIDTVVIRLKIKEENTFSKFLNYAKNVVHDAIANKDIPFERIVDAVKPERSTNMNPLFQVSLSWWSNFINPIELGEIIGERVTIKDGISPFDITFYLWENSGIIEGEIEYNIDILKRDTIIRLKDSFIHLLSSIADNPDQSISDISIVSENGRTILDGFNNTEVSIPDCLVQEFFEKKVELAPMKTAVIAGSESLSYKDLDNKANQLARHFIALGITSGDTIGLCIERSVEMLISVLAILKAGCCYLPIDPSFPDESIQYMIADSEAKILISQYSLREKFRNLPEKSLVLIDTDWCKITENITVKLYPNISPQSLAYIIYTSGSTGRPKGVKVHHQSVVNLINSMSKTPGIKENDILLAVVTLSFDMSVFELFLPLSKGATIVIASRQDTINGQALINLIDTHKITMLQATPSLFNILIASGWKGKNDLRAFCGGEALSKDLVRQILPKVAEFWNCYGPTETTVYATCIKVADTDAPILIGKPLDNTRIYILDKNNNTLPLGVIGEVGIGGLCVTKGYNKLPELTSEKFISIENGQFIYKTGDLGRFHIDGNIELFGRIDNQVKLRGFRIEPGEIETILSNFEGVKEAVVKLHKFAENDERIIAFLNVGSEFKMTKEEIAGFVAQKLPLYMLPSFFQVMDSFPRLQNGKINKKELLFEASVLEQNQKIVFNTFTETQKKIFDVWKDVLKTSDFKISDNFFDVGGNSLLAISVISKLKSTSNIDLKLRVFFDSPRIKDLAHVIDITLKKTAENKQTFKKEKTNFKIIKGEI